MRTVLTGACLAVLLMATPAVHAQEGVCGDVTGDGLVSIPDYLFMAHYLFDDGPAPESLWTADMDGVAGITVSDLQILLYVPGIPDLHLTCSPQSSSFAPSSNDTTEFWNTTLPPANGVDIPWYVELWHTTNLPGGGVANGLTGYSLPFSYACSTSAITLDTIISHVNPTLVRTRIDPVNQTALFAFSEFPSSDLALGGQIHLATLVFRIAQSDALIPTHILLDTIGYAPSNTTVAVENYMEPSVPTILGLQGSDPGPASCCVGVTGDVNSSGNFSLTDLTQMVNMLFVTFQPVACRPSANVSGDAACVINMTDLSLMVMKFIFPETEFAPCNWFDPQACEGL